MALKLLKIDSATMEKIGATEENFEEKLLALADGAAQQTDPTGGGDPGNTGEPASQPGQGQSAFGGDQNPQQTPQQDPAPQPQQGLDANNVRQALAGLEERVARAAEAAASRVAASLIGRTGQPSAPTGNANPAPAPASANPMQASDAEAAWNGSESIRDEFEAVGEDAFKAYFRANKNGRIRFHAKQAEVMGSARG